MRRSDPDRIADFFRHGLASSGEGERGMKLARPLVKDVQTAYETQLIRLIPEFLGELEASHVSHANLLAVTFCEHKRHSERRLKRHVPAISTCAVIERGKRLLGPAVTLG
jgi:hypothetical protein